MTIERLQDYQIKDFIAPGGTSAVFSALRRNAAIQTPWRVAVKIVWDIGLARHEAENLVALTDSRGVVNLMDYFELPYRTIAPYLDHVPADAGSTFTATTVERDFSLEDETRVGCLVLQYLAGTPLVKQTVAVEEDEEQRYEDAISVKDLESGRWLRQMLAFKIDLEQRLDLLIQLADYIEDCHRNNIVHGDLKPQNILYNAENQKVTILDFGGSTEITRGSPGWQAPEHFQFVLGELDVLPKSTDVFLIGLFVHRFLAGEKIEGLEDLVGRCLTEPENRIDAGELKRELKAIQKRLFAPKRRIFSSAAMVTIFALIAVIVYQFAQPKELQNPLRERFGKTNGSELIEIAETADLSSHSSKFAFFKDIYEIHRDPNAWPELKENLNLARAKVYKKWDYNNITEPFDYTTINYMRVASDGVQMRYDRSGRSNGTLVEGDYYLDEIIGHIKGWATFNIILKNFDGEIRERTVSPFPFLAEVIEDNYIFFNDISLLELLKFIPKDKQYEIVYGCDDIRVTGFIYYDEYSKLLERVLEFTDWEIRDDVLYVESCKQSEIYYAYFSSVHANKGEPLKGFLNFVDGLLDVPVVDPHNYLEGLEVQYDYQSTSVHWQSFFNEILRPVCMTTIQQNDVVVVTPLTIANDF